MAVPSDSKQVIVHATKHALHDLDISARTYREGGRVLASGADR
jgi:hypothetical protein